MLRILVISFLGLVAGAPLGQQQTSCEVCQLLVGELQDYLTTSQSKISVGNYVRDICSKLPDKEKDVCLTFTNDNAASFFSKLNSDLSPKSFCENIPDVCPVEHVETTDEKVQGPVECAICELAVLGIDRVIKTNSSSGEINSTLEKFCASLPFNLTETCQRIEPDILRGLKNGLNPKIACKLARLCLASESDVINTIPCDMCHTAIDAMGITDTGSVCNQLESCTANAEEVEIEPAVGDDAGCEICKLLVIYIDQLIQNNSTVKSINTTLYGICNALPANFKLICDGAIPTILGAIGNGIDPNQACIASNFCPNVTEIAVGNACEMCMTMAENNKDGQMDELVLDTTCTRLCHARTRRSVDSIIEQFDTLRDEIKHDVTVDPCTDCKLLLQGIDLIIGNNFTVETVDKAMTGICNAMAGDSTRDYCTRAIPKIVELLENGVKPEDACKVIGLCNAAPARSKRMVLSQKKMPHGAQRNTAQLGDSAECEICEGLADILDMLLKENVTTDFVNKTMYDICTNLPATALQEMCLQATPKLIQAMMSGLDAKDVCDKLKLCNATQYDKDHDDTYRKVLKPVIQSSKLTEVNWKCDTCEYVINELDKELADNATDAVINSTVYDICGKLKGALRDLCLSAAPSIVNSLESGVEAKMVCSSLKLCNATALDIETTQTLKVDYKCDICNFVINEVDKGLADNASDVKINATVYGACNKLNGFFRDLCLANAEKIVNALEQGFDTKGVCNLIKLCNTTVQNTGRSKELKVDYVCDICNFVIEEFDKALADNGTDVKINATVYGACNKLDGFFRDLCVANADKIVNGLEQGFDPKGVCKLFKLCNATFVYTKSLSRPSGNLQDVKCTLCELAVKEIDSIVGRNGSVEQINSTVYELCGKLGGSIQKLCLEVAPTIVTAISSGVDPEEACTLLKLCDATAVNPPSLSQPVANLQDVKCTLCELAVKEIDSIVGRNGSVEQINSTVYELCGKLGGSIQKLCLEVAPTIVTAISSGVDPEEACTLLKLCDATAVNPPSLSQPVANLQDVKCTLCELAVKEIDSIVGRNGSVEQINSTVYELCGKLGGSIQKLCLEVAPTIVTAISSGVDPEEACTLLKLCDATDINTKLLSQEDTANLKDTKCTLCEFAVKEIDSIVGKNGSMEQINSTLYELCERLSGNLQELRPLFWKAWVAIKQGGSLIQECLEVAPKIVTALASGADPEETCKLVKLCDATDVYIQLLSNTETKPEDTKCTLCEFAMKEIDSIVAQNGSIEQINATLYQLCDRLSGNLQDMCLQVVPKIVTALSSGADPEETCKLIKLCDATDVNIQLFSPAEANVQDTKCTLCEFAVKEIESIVAQNGSIEQINATLYQLCDRLSGNLQKMCLEQVPKIIMALSNGTDPEKTCQLIKLCDATDVNIQLSSPAEANVQDTKCTLCEFAVKEIESIVAQNGSIEQINATLYQLCDRLSGNLQEMCLEQVPKIIMALSNGTDPEKTCQLIKLCDATDINIQLSSPAETNVQDTKCTLCEFAVKEIESIVAQNGSIEQINATLYQLCDRLSGNLQEMCLEQVPKIIMALSNGTDPEKTCQLIKLCDATDVNIQLSSLAKTNVQDTKCTLCEFAVKEIDSIVAQNASIEQINATLYQLCDRLSGNLQEMCLELVPKILMALSNSTDPEKTCELIKLCDATDVNIQLFSQAETQVQDTKCTLCEFAVKEIDSIVAQNGSIEQINATLYQLCDRLSGNLQDMCLQIVPKIIMALSNGTDPEKTCEMIKLCDATGVETQILGRVEDNLKDLKCELCEEILTEIDSIIKSNSSDEKINSTVYGLCNQLPGPIKDECLQLAPKIVTAIVSGVDPNMTCEAIKLCNAVEVNTQLLRPTEGNLKDLKCELCEDILTEIDSIIKSNSSDEKINSTVYGLCNQLPGPIKDMCLELAPKIVTAIVSGVDPNMTCEAIKICNNVAEVNTQLLRPTEGNLKDLKCELCEDILTEIDSIIKSNSSDEKINSTVYGLCNQLPGPIKDMCLELAPKIVTAIVSGVDPNMTCEAIKICNNVVVEDVNVVLSTKGSIDCQSCRNALQYVYEDVQQDYPKIQNLMTQLCGRLPPAYRTVCVELFEEDNGVTFKTFLQRFTPVLMCEMAQCVENADTPTYTNLS